MKPRTRTIHRKQLVPHTVDGKTELVLDEFTVEVPLPPRDWDSIVRTGITALACVLVTVSLTWTTASIGDLLSMAVTPGIAYGAGVAFDAAWILCMAVEWLLRYDPDRAALPRRAGHVALLVSMGAVYAHGHLTGQWVVGEAGWVVGAAGAAVSLLAKGGWTIAMRAHARPLDPRTTQWVAKQRAALDGQLAMIPVRRELLRGEALLEAEREARTADSDGSANPDRPGSSADRPTPSASGGARRSLTTKDAARIVWDRGIRDEDEAVREIANLVGRPVSPDTVVRYLRDLRNEEAAS